MSNYSRTISELSKIGLFANFNEQVFFAHSDADVTVLINKELIEKLWEVAYFTFKEKIMSPF